MRSKTKTKTKINTKRRFSRRTWTLLSVGTLLAALGPAQATFHLMNIVELFPGTPASPNAQYVVLQMYASGQDLVSGHNFIFYNASGQVVSSFIFPHNVANGANQSKILIATPEAATFFGVQPDFTMPAQLMRAGGKVCFADGIDCVAWGAYTGGTAGVGTPFNRTGGGLLQGRSAVRRLDISGSANTLDSTDDTDDSANDFRFDDSPEPRNNAGQDGHAPPSTCGNARIEGLELCDDGNTANGDSCSSTCKQVTTPANPYRPYADFDGNGRSDLPWRNIQTGQNAIWRSALSTASTPVSAVTNQAWRIVGVGDFNGDGRADLLWRNTANGGNTIWRSGSSSFITPVTTLDTTWSVAGIGDFDGDRKSDIVWRNLSGQNAIWRSGSSATRTAVTAVTNTQWRIAGVGDFNGDGRADLLWRNSTTASNVIWRSASSSLLTSVTSLDRSWSVGGIGDFDADGKSDILWRNLSGQNAIWRSGNSAGRVAVATMAGTAWHVEAVADYNGDRRSDLMWRNNQTGSNIIWRSASSGAPTAVTALPTSWTVAP